MSRLCRQTDRGQGTSRHRIGRHRVRSVIAACLCVLAVGILLYPVITNWLQSQKSAEVIHNYNQTVNKTPSAHMTKILSQAQAHNAQLYNDYLFSRSQHVPWPGKPVPDYLDLLNVGSQGMMGYISIPQLKVSDIPIYHGDSLKTLEFGAGHIPQSSLPIGGKNTHALLTAHSGRPNDSLFTNLDKLKEKDVFYIDVLDLKLKYQIVDIKTVDPHDVSSLSIQEGKDLVTLVTCWPTGINSQRLLVTGTRIPLDQVTPTQDVSRNSFGYDFWALTGIGLLGLGLLAYFLAKRLKRRKKAQS